MALQHGHSHCATWLDRSVGWAPIHRVCDSRRGAPHLIALLRDGANPMLMREFGETPLQICEMADPAKGALPEDNAMTKLIKQALRPWHQTRHGPFPRSFTPRVISFAAHAPAAGAEGG